MVIFNIDCLGYSSDLNGIEKLPKNRYKHLHINLKDEDNTNNALNEADPDVINSLAAESHVDRSIDQRILLIAIFTGTFNLLESISQSLAKTFKKRKENFRFASYKH